MKENKIRANKNKKDIRKVALILGIALSIYPLLADVWNKRKQESVVSTYRSTVQEIQTDHLSETEIIGIIEIPKIDVSLPVYHGTDEDVLSVGVGHLEDTSLPVGGKNTHSVLTGHRGLPNAKLFTRLDEMEIGDLFFVEVCDKKLAYQVCDIQVIKPEDAEELDIVAGKDLVSLLTCTPYGINSHRLVVTGERTEYQEEVKEHIQPQMPSIREIVFTVLPFFSVAIVLTKCLVERRKKRREA